jgi:hypothetical protein
MTKYSMAVVAFATGFSSAGLFTVAAAQNLTAAQRTACKADYQKHCSAVTPGGGRIIACLNKQRDALNEACKKVLDAQMKQ